MLTWKDKALFTPGPLTTSRTVKQAMLRDLGSRDPEFIELVAGIRRRLLRVGVSSEETYTAIIMQGSGTFGIEAVISSVVPNSGRLLVLVNGAYGERMLNIAQVHHIPYTIQRGPEDRFPDLDLLEKNLIADPQISHVAVVHCETTTGILNPIQEIGAIVKKHRRTYIVDAMSSFGGYPLAVEALEIDYLVSSSNKCIEGVPGFSFILARKETLQVDNGNARTLSLDIHRQWQGLEKDGQFNFTPPVQTLLAFHQALLELEAEGGPVARSRRYQDNCDKTLLSMLGLGFRTYLGPEKRGHTITSFYYPDHPNFSFATFYQKLSEKGCLIYPGKLSQAACFRIGHIGRLDQADIFTLIAAIKQTLLEMDIRLN